MPRYRLLVEYDGTDFHGWQRQPDTRTVQGEIESALLTTTRTPISVTGSGRTDAGVHARGQVAHFDLGEDVDTSRLGLSLNALTPRDIAIRGIWQTHRDFHARYDAYQRRYCYYISTLPTALDRSFRHIVRQVAEIERMNEAAKFLIAERDYSCFCLTQSETENRVCDIKTARWEKGSNEGEWHFTIAADRFLHGMVRAIVGTLLEIGRSYRSVDDLERTIESKDRRRAGAAAPACGLVLEQVYYRTE